jgi:hypothetical protein
MKNNFTTLFLLALFVFALGISSNLYAADTAPAASKPPSNSLPATGPSGDHPCAKDAQSLCAGKTYGKGLVKCMKENKAKLAPACQEKLETFFAPDRAKKTKK